MLKILFIFLTSLQVSALTPFEAREKILTQYVNVNPPQTWAYDWTTAIFLYGVLASMPAEEAVLPASRIQSALGDVWAKRPAAVTSPDLAAMSLPMVLLPNGGDQRFINATETYFHTEPLNAGGVFDHVGPRHRYNPWLPPTQWVMPSSVWADSAVMYALNGFLISRKKNEARDQLFFERQILRIHKWLWQPNAQLYKHAYFFGDRSFAPSEGYWARGNLWMALAFETVAESLPAQDPSRAQFTELFQTIMRSLRSRVDATRGLTTLLEWPSESNDFETTASALFAHLEMRGARLGLLPRDQFRVGHDLAHALAKTKLEVVDSTRLSVRGISCPTTAMSWPSYYTRVVGECVDQSYGVGAFLLMLSDL